MRHFGTRRPSPFWHLYLSFERLASRSCSETSVEAVPPPWITPVRLPVSAFSHADTVTRVGDQRQGRTAGRADVLWRWIRNKGLTRLSLHTVFSLPRRPASCCVIANPAKIAPDQDAVEPTSCIYRCSPSGRPRGHSPIRRVALFYQRASPCLLELRHPFDVAGPHCLDYAHTPLR